ncbi:UNVERIFIED_CONTAM: hypothetical protein PYX00_004016 [Menopon gallinae]|uniref:Choline transporter-like protein n=1 Tax=Menopon gallinae TaxID=328185 RepID=A0AAW2I400_9NEOP
MSRDKSRKKHSKIERDDESINCCQLDVHKALIKERNYPKREPKDLNLHGKRSCTDVFCLFIFVGAVIGWLGVSAFVFKNGGPEKALAPVDSHHRRCGFDAGVEDRPYLFYFDITKCLPPRKNLFFCDTPQVCVKECPKTSFSSSYYLETLEPFWSIKEKLICVEDFDKHIQINSYGDVRNAIEGGYCADWYMESEPIFRHCLPRQMSALDSNSLARVRLPEGPNVELNGVKATLLRSAANEIKNADGFFQRMAENLLEEWKKIVLFVCLATFLSFVFIVIMRWISGIIIWASIIGLIALLCFTSFYTWKKFNEVKEQETVLDSSKILLFASLRIDTSQLKDDILMHKYTWLAFFILSLMALLLIVVILLFLRNRITLAIQLIKEGSKAVSYAWTSLIFPPFPWVIQLAIFVQAACIFCFLIGEKIPIYRVTGINGTDCTCSNGYKEGDICNMETFKAMCFNSYGETCTTAQCIYSADEAENYTIYLHLFNIFMLLWSEYFVSGFTQMSLAMTFAVYYWTASKRKLPFCIVGKNTYRVIRYHLGTIAFGSFLLALLNWLRLLIEASYRYINKGNSSVTKCLKCCCGCILACLHKILRILTKNAYIMCAMKGTNYCISAQHAFTLIIKNILRASILDGVTSFLFFIMKLLITGIVGVLAFYCFSNSTPDLRNPNETDISFEYYFFPIIVTCLATYFVASLFFGVYATAVDTIFLCALEDLDRNTGLPDKPYAMSKGLIRIFQVKNKRRGS